MPITPTAASLWFSSKQEEEKYDDMMMANIEIKSEDPDDEHYTMVFTRPKQEKFFEYSDLAKNDISKYKNMFELSANDYYKRYAYKGGEALHWKEWVGHKRTNYWAFSYLLLRELPIRNFYARAFVMAAFAGKYWDENGFALPFTSGGLKPVPLKQSLDQFEGFRDTECFNQQREYLTQMRLPTAENQLPESVRWRANQPGHYNTADNWTVLTYAGKIAASSHTAFWDGSFNQPLHALGHPLHKDCSHLE